jgi:hypothetical protein
MSLWYFRSLAHRQGFTDRQFEDGEIYEATLLESGRDINGLAEDYSRVANAYASTRDPV